MRRNSLWLALGLALAALAGCAPTYPNCNSDENCTERGEVCVQGSCQECATDANCKEGFRCEAGKCTTGSAQCTSDDACGAGKICEAGRCATAQCSGDAQCGTGKCNRGRCAVASEDSCTTSDDCGDGRSCKAGRCVTGGACNWDAIPFGFNDSNLGSEASSQLGTLAACIKKDNTKVTIGGHADERGTEEYNLQLSNRRAASVKKFLTDLGVPAKLLQTVGYGENQPVSSSQDESGWAANRRVDFKH